MIVTLETCICLSLCAFCAASQCELHGCIAVHYVLVLLVFLMMLCIMGFITLGAFHCA